MFCESQDKQAIFPLHLPLSNHHAEIHLSLLLPVLSASFIPHGSPQIDGALF